METRWLVPEEDLMIQVFVGGAEVGSCAEAPDNEVASRDDWDTFRDNRDMEAWLADLNT